MSNRNKEKFKQKLLEHTGNIAGSNGRKTELISEYKGRAYSHIFKCGLCGNEFARVIDDMLREGRHCCCYECSLNKKRQMFQITLEEAQERIDQRFGKDVIEIDESVIINMRTNMDFFCHQCNKPFTKRLVDLLRSRGCPNCLPYGYSKMSILWLDSLEIKTIQHAENGGEHRIKNSKYWADGYDLATNTIYEFHGCDIHGHIIENPTCTRCTEKNGLTPYGYSFQEALDKLNKKRLHIHKEQYNYVEIWECELHKNMPKIVALQLE